MNKEKKYIIFGIVMIVVLLIGFTYAFYQSEMNSNNSKVTIDTDDMRIIFTNGDAIEASDVYAEDNLDIVKTFSVENKTSKEYKYNIVFEDLVNTFKTTGFLVYKITSDDGGYNMTDFIDIPKSLTATNTVLAYSVTIPAKSIQNYTIEIKYINSETENQDDDQGAVLTGKLYISKGTNKPRYTSLINAILEDNPTISERTDFKKNTETTTGTIYKTNKTENGSDVYYYSGNTTNNWVKFGKYSSISSISGRYYADGSEFYDEFNTMEECTSHWLYSEHGKCGYLWKKDDDMYWRIIRTNEDGSIRLLYAGISPNTTEGYIGASQFNNPYDDQMYVGYMYGTSGSLANNRTNENDSKIKIFIDKWYEKNLLNNYDKFISKSAIYCNDRSINSSGKNFGAFSRTDALTPSYKCGEDGSGGLFESTQAIADKFSASTTGGGNGLLKYPVALMTLDEVDFAGDPSLNVWFNTNGDGALNGGAWQLISPTYVDRYVAYVEDKSTPNSISAVSHNVRPVISLDSCVTIKSGNGTPTDPYVVDETSCS